MAMSLGARTLSLDGATRVGRPRRGHGGHQASVEVACATSARGDRGRARPRRATPFELSAQTLVRRQLVLRGSLTYDHPGDFRATVARVRAGGDPPGDESITDEYPLDDAQRAFEASASARGKTWIRVAGSALA